jgi:hypothetical protein
MLRTAPYKGSYGGLTQRLGEGRTHGLWRVVALRAFMERSGEMCSPGLIALLVNI